MLRTLAALVYRRRRIVVAAWALLFVVGIGLGVSVFDRLEAEGLDSPPAGSEAERVAQRIGGLSLAELPGESLYAVYDGAAVDVSGTVAALEALPEVESVQTAVATDGLATAVLVEMELGPVPADAVVRILRDVDAPTVLVSGDRLVDDEFGSQAEADLLKAELLSFPVLLVLLLVLFGGVVAAGLPLIISFCALAGTLLALLVASHLVDVSVFAVNVATMLGLGLGVDYALLVVNRFREERGAGHDVPAAIERTMATAGRTVVFSGLTVAVAMSGLLVFDDMFLQSMALGGVVVVLIGLSAALTLLPALLGCWGHRIRPPRSGDAAAGHERGVFARLSRLVQRRALPIVVVVGCGLALLGTPFLHAHYEEPDARFLPTSSESRRIADIVDTRFPMGSRTDPVVVLAETSDQEALGAFVAELEALPGVTSVTARPPLADGVSVVDVVPDGPTEGETAQSLVGAIRSLDPPFEIGLTGDAAGLVDTRAHIGARLPWSVGLIATATLVLLFLLTGSVVVPVKALLMNLLSLGASFGALVWVFQDGHLTGLLGIDPVGAIDVATPLLVFVIAFGLSMDYEVFLLARIKEAWDETGDNDLAVAVGLQRTGRIVTSAAALIVVVFLGFMAGGFLSVKQVGLGLALAVILDATVIRMLLVPATMRLLGRWNWWAPAPLRRLHDLLPAMELPAIEQEALHRPADAALLVEERALGEADAVGAGAGR